MKKIISILLFVVLAVFTTSACSSNESADIVIFTQTGCGHCESAMNYINTVILKEMPNTTVAEYNIRESDKNYKLFLTYVQKYQPSAKSIGTPFIVVGKKSMMGWTEETQQELTNRVRNLHN